MCMSYCTLNVTDHVFLNVEIDAELHRKCSRLLNVPHILLFQLSSMVFIYIFTEIKVTVELTIMYINSIHFAVSINFFLLSKMSQHTSD